MIMDSLSKCRDEEGPLLRFFFNVDSSRVLSPTSQHHVTPSTQCRLKHLHRCCTVADTALMPFPLPSYMTV